MLHTIRQIVGDDEKWRSILTGLNTTFWHQTVMGKQVEDYISKRAGMDLGKVFEQYLTTTMIPTFEYRIANDSLYYRWGSVVPGFNMPVKVTVKWPEFAMLHPTEAWQSRKVKLPNPSDFRVDQNFYVIPKDVSGPP